VSGILWWVLGGFAVFLGGVAFLGWQTPPAPARRANPTANRDEALARLKAHQAAEGVEIADPCRTQLLEPVGDAKATIVVLHGLANCPNQFRPAADVLLARGYRVLLPLQPAHGRADVLAGNLGVLTSETIAAFVDDVCDIAVGFGDPVHVFGLSAGGVLAYWAAATRDDIRFATAASPVASPTGVPIPISRVLARFAPMLRKIFIWWDPRKKADLGESPYVYPGFHLAGLAAYLHLANLLADRKVEATYVVERAALVSNPGDFAIRRDAAIRLMHRTFSGRADHTEEFVLRKDLGWWHDFADQDGPHHGTPEQVADVIDYSLGLDPEAGADLFESVRES
jgi:pimeloyl-ACP methyl ester carboxylesterase